MQAIQGVIDNSSPLYNGLTNKITIQHDIGELFSMPYCISVKNQEGNYEEIEVSSVVFTDRSIIISLGSFVFGSGDKIAYSFSISSDESNSDGGVWQ